MKIPRVHRVWKGDKLHRYHRVTRKRLPDDIPEDHPDFLAAWLAEEGGTPKVTRKAAPGSISATCDTLLASERYHRLSSDYRRVVKRHLDAIKEQGGNLPVSSIKAEHIEDDLAPLSPSVARARRKAWRHLCGFAFDARLIRTDPSEAVRAVKMPKTDGHPPWSNDDVKAYRDRWKIGTVQRAAMELLFWTGARASDGCRLMPSMLGKDGILTYRQEKTGSPAHVPWTCALPDWAAPMIADRDMMHEALKAYPFKGMTYLETAHGRARTKKGLSNLISEGCFGAEMTGRSAHGLRKSRLTIIAELGGPTSAIMAWGGHTTLQEAEHYTKAADRKRTIRGTEQDRNLVNGVSSGCKLSQERYNNQ